MDKPGRNISLLELIALSCILIAAATLRIAAARGEMWCDEIVSWHIAQQVHSPLDIFARVHEDNNHPLNTLWMYLVGPARSPMLYRAPAIVAGVISVALMWILGRRMNRAAGLIAAILGATSYFLIHYSSEARGYSLAVCMALACYALMRAYVDSPRRLYSLLFSVCAIAGILGHLTFAFAYLGILFWSLVEFRRRYSPVRDFVSQIVRCHAVPLVAFAIFALLNVRPMNVAESPVAPTYRVVGQAMTWVFGFPRDEFGMLLAGTIVLIVAILELYLSAREGSREWIYYLTTILLAPAAIMLLRPSPSVFPRYFIVCVPFALLLLAQLTGRLWTHGTVGKSLAAIVVLALLAGNAVCLREFFRAGRAHIVESVQFMAGSDVGKIVTVGSFQDSRNAIMFEYACTRLSPEVNVRYVNQADWTKDEPPWLIVDVGQDGETPPIELRASNGRRYVLARTYGYWGLSGFDWYVYRAAE